MPEMPELVGKRVLFVIEPFGAPAATDFYANLTGVGSGPAEMVLAFAQAMPGEEAGDEGRLRVEPKVRVTLPVAAAHNLVAQLRQQLEMRAKLAGVEAEEGEVDVGTQAAASGDV